ncbi:MAG: hypothetical protein ACM3VY_00135 [Candidatus Bathyarchaeota archaeon]
MSTTRTQNIDQQLRSLRASLAQANSDRDAVALRVAEGDQKAIDEVAAIDEEIRQTQSRISILEAAKREAERQDTTEARAARRAEAERLHAEAIRLASDRIKIAEEIDATAAKLGPLLTKWAEVSQDCRRMAVESIDGLVSDYDAARRIKDLVVSNCSGSNSSFAAALNDVLYASGVGRIGIPGQGLFLTLNPGGSLNLAKMAKLAADQIAERLNRAMEKSDV